MIETGIYFGDIHSYYGLNLILSSVDISPASPKTNYIDIRGADGLLDLTEAHGEIRYKNRDCTFTFTINPSETLNFEEKKTQVANALNGKHFRITLDKDSDYYYSGRCTVNSYKQDKNLKQIVISATVEPYKYKQKPTVIAYKLDAEARQYILVNDRKSVVPTITTIKPTTIEFNGNVFELGIGTHRILEICLVEGENVLSIASDGGTITFTYQEGEL